MEKLSPEIALDKYYEMWNAMAKVEKENEITEKNFYRFEFRMDFKEDWCKEKGENPVNNCYLCEYALQANLGYQSPQNCVDYINKDKTINIYMTREMCKHCPILWNEDRNDNNCEQDDTNWTLSPIKDILALPINTEEIKEYHTNNT